MTPTASCRGLGKRPYSKQEGVRRHLRHASNVPTANNVIVVGSGMTNSVPLATQAKRRITR